MSPYCKHFDKTMSENNPISNSVMEIFERFIYDGLVGFVSLRNDRSDAIHIKILRATGSSQSI